MNPVFIRVFSNKSENFSKVKIFFSVVLCVFSVRLCVTTNNDFTQRAQKPDNYRGTELLRVTKGDLLYCLL